MHTYHNQLSGTLTWLNWLSITLDIALALDYLHSQANPPIIHRDVKSSNILLMDDNHAKLANFGLCILVYDTKHGSQTPTIVKGSFGYVNIHYLNIRLVSIKSDVYNFGVLLLELITGLKSTQGLVTLAGWIEDSRKITDIEVLSIMLDPKLNGNADLEQLRVLINIANLALLENSEGRPGLSYIVDRISSCMECDQL